MGDLLGASVCSLHGVAACEWPVEMPDSLSCEGEAKMIIAMCYHHDVGISV